MEKLKIMLNSTQVVAEARTELGEKKFKLDKDLIRKLLKADNYLKQLHKCNKIRTKAKRCPREIQGIIPSYLFHSFNSEILNDCDPMKMLAQTQKKVMPCVWDMYFVTAGTPL